MRVCFQWLKWKSNLIHQLSRPPNFLTALEPPNVLVESNQIGVESDQTGVQSSLFLTTSTSLSGDIVHGQSDSSSSLYLIGSGDVSTRPTGVASTHRMVTRSKNGVFEPNLKYALVSQTMIIKEPASDKEALQHSGWVQAVKDELASLEKNNARSLVPRQADMNVIGIK